MPSEQDFFRTLAEFSPDIICYVSLDRVITYASPSCRQTLGWQPGELVGTGPSFVVHPDDLAKLEVAAEETAAPNGDLPVITVRARHKGGHYTWVEMEARPVLDSATGAPTQLVLVMRNAAERVERERRLEALASTDGLTGLLNRRSFDQRLEQAWDDTVRSGSHMSLVLLDIDHFKSFNDRYGHQAGDDCLRAVASVLLASVSGQVAHAARYGGEELAIILPATEAAAALRLAESVRSTVERLRVPHAGSSTTDGFLSVSLGVATVLALHGGSMRMPDSLLLSADTALYKAKRQGRNRVEAMLVLAPRTL